MKYHAVLIKALVEALKDIFEKNYYADKVIEWHFKKNKKWGKRDRQFFAETIYDMTRWWARLAAYDGQSFIPQNYYLRWLVYEYWKNGQDLKEFLNTKIPDSKIDPQLDFKKAVEKKINPELELSFPNWFLEKIKKDYPNDYQNILSGLNQPAPVYLRANTLKTVASDLQKKLLAEEIQTDLAKSSDCGLKLKERKNVFITQAFKNGLFEVQDLASQKVAQLLSPKPGERVADVCAGAGGKTLHLAALMQNKGTLLASDIHQRKLEELKVRARRAGVSNLKIQLAENSKDIKKHYGKFDAVLIDAPCSGSGVIRRNPDSKWKFKPEDLEQVKATQLEVLEQYSKFLKPGGRLVYATCSIFKEENEDQIEKFLSSHSEFKLQESFHCRPDLSSEDGFYAVLLQRE